MTKGPESLQDVLERVLAGMDVAPAPVLISLQEEWGALAGKPWSDHARPIVVAGGELIVEAVQPGLVATLRYATGDLQRRLDARFGAGVIEAIRVRAPAWSKPPPTI